MYDVACWLIHEGNLIPIRFREGPRRIKIMPRGSRVTPKNIHLTYFFGNRLHVLVRVGIFGSIKTKWGLVDVAMRNRHVPTVRIIGRRPKHIPRLIKIKSPCIIRRRRHMFHFRTIGFETEKCLCELQGISTHFSFVSRITYTTPNPVIKAIM